MLPDLTPTLYTSCVADGAMAEIVHYWRQLTPMPSKPVTLHELRLHTKKSLRLGRPDLEGLGVNWATFATGSIERTQAIGAAVAHLEYDGLIAPSARWACDNVMLFMTNHDGLDDSLVVVRSEDVDWRDWMQRNMHFDTSESGRTG
jgi:hypothetical protein